MKCDEWQQHAKVENYVMYSLVADVKLENHAVYYFFQWCA